MYLSLSDSEHSKQQQHHNNMKLTPRRLCSSITSLLLEPCQWLQMLFSNLNPTFILGIFLVYGVIQGFGSSYIKVVTYYYWKDVQKLQPSLVQLFIGLYLIPYVMKPFWGLLTDVFPIRGYRRRPYFVGAGVLGASSAVVVAEVELPRGVALGCIIGLTATIAIAEVTIDACIARCSKEVSGLAPDLQSLCGACSSVGALVGFSISGFCVQLLGAQGAVGVLAFPAILLIVLGFVIYEVRTNTLHSEKKKKKVMENIKTTIGDMCDTIKLPHVWKPTLYMFLSIALGINTYEGQFYWYTNPKAGPAFSEDFVGMIYAVGAMASIGGVLIYQKTLKNLSVRNFLFFAQLLYGVSGMLDLVFVLRWNLALGIPDSFFVIEEECVLRIFTKTRWMPMIVLSTKLCPLGIEGTFFALLMCIDAIGVLTSRWAGGMVLHAFHITRTDFSNLWLVIFIRNILRFGTLGLVFLVPKGDRSDVLTPSGRLKKNLDVEVGAAGNGDGDEGSQLIPMSEKNVV